ncbi:MAG: hypothetical protein ACOC5F_03065 [Candidatus Aminicenantaceae bacterium]
MLFSNPYSKAPPAWWTIEIRLDTQGSYQVKEKGPVYFGYYFFSSSIKGWMEKDEDDFLLYQRKPKVVKWEAQEIAIYADNLEMKTTAEFRRKPDLKLNYLLQKEHSIHFDLITTGFSIPQNHSVSDILLGLPASKENSLIVSNIKYNAFIKNGSNEIKIEEKNIYSKPLKKEFNWKWRYQNWKASSQTTVFFSHNHSAEVKIHIIPHW